VSSCRAAWSRFRNVPPELHRRLKARAAIGGPLDVGLRPPRGAQGPRRPTRQEVLERLQARPCGGSIGARLTCSGPSATRDDRARRPALVELLLGTEMGRSVATRIADPAISLHVPHWRMSKSPRPPALRPGRRAGRRLRRRGDRRPERARPAAALPRALLGRVWALRQNLTACDAVYVALAEALDAKLLTCDSPRGSRPGHGPARRTPELRARRGPASRVGPSRLRPRSCQPKPAGRAGRVRSGTAASSRCPRAPRCGSARQTARACRTSL